MAPLPKPFTPEIEKMLALATRRRFAPKSLIVHEGAMSTELFFILRGWVTVRMEDADGHELILSYLGPGEFFGELGFFGTAAKRSAYVSTRSECERSEEHTLNSSHQSTSRMPSSA